jgi:hypothetical protein
MVPSYTNKAGLQNIFYKGNKIVVLCLHSNVICQIGTHGHTHVLRIQILMFWTQIFALLC